ncbi:hypothetical protein [Ornithinimicrobium sufpigmenti]|uniref:hypothetical protein n=1 Tax=Ornithinimicrobium sufpigmenti TaxID=2508882 RepID=UPI00104CC924|nr:MULTISPECIES: hypothetical protein [unclassified Ornithinimicrobium]
MATAVAALRKPSVAAAAVNALVRAEDPVVDRLREVGTRMRHAQSALDAQGLAALRGERDAVLHDWVEAARTHAPASLTPAVEAEVRDTAVAALADGAATDVVLSGTLTRALSYSGFGEVDVSDAVARTSTGVVLTRIEGGGGGDTDADADDLEDSEADEADPGDEDHVDVDEGEDVENNVEREDVEDNDEREDVEEDVDDEDVDEDEGDQSVEPDEDEPDIATGDGLARLEEDLAEAEEQVTAARRERRSLLEAAKAAAAQLADAEDALAEARRLLTRAEKEAEHAQSEDERARAALEDADDALAAARKRRAEARTALEEAEDAE